MQCPKLKLLHVVYGFTVAVFQNYGISQGSERVNRGSGPVYMVSGTRDNPSARDNFAERLYGVVSCNS